MKSAQHLNKLSLRDRMRRACGDKRLKPLFQLRDSDSEQFIGKLVDVRNAVSHHSFSDGIYDDLYYAHLEKVCTILDAFIFIRCADDLVSENMLNRRYGPRYSM